MPSKSGYSEEKYRKMIQEGRGSGYGSNYKPWITVRDFASEGKSHRILGIKTKKKSPIIL